MEKLAKIRNCHLNTQDHGGLLLNLVVEYEDGGCQDIFCKCLDTYDETLKSRIGTAYGCEIIRRVLDIFKANDLTELKGKYVWVIGEGGNSLDFTPYGIRSPNVYKHKSAPLYWEDVRTFFSLREDPCIK